jgi:hypothetical protein
MRATELVAVPRAVAMTSVPRAGSAAETAIRWGLPRRRSPAGTVLAAGTARDTRLAIPLDRAAALVAGLVHGAPPPQLQALINSLSAGCGLHIYIPN